MKQQKKKIVNILKLPKSLLSHISRILFTLCKLRRKINLYVNTKQADHLDQALILSRVTLHVPFFCLHAFLHPQHKVCHHILTYGMACIPSLICFYLLGLLVIHRIQISLRLKSGDERSCHRGAYP